MQYPPIIDLHAHSTASDGTYAPAEVAELAQKIGLSAIALTDHDTIDGLEEFQKAIDLTRNREAFKVVVTI